MILTDTHTHLNSAELAYSADILIKRAGDQQVSRFFIPNIDAETIDEVLNLSIRFPDCCFPMLGLHPVHVQTDYISQLEIILEAARANKIYAIGEIGMDFYRDANFVDQQTDAFIIQARLAAELDLPLVIHCRNAFTELTSLMKSLKHIPMRGIFHCFTGTKEEAKEILDMGFFLGIGGVVTYKNSILPETLKYIPLTSMVLETDAPYLSPVPKRGKPNEPANIIFVAQRLAEIKETSVEEVARITTENSVGIFGR